MHGFIGSKLPPLLGYIVAIRSSFEFHILFKAKIKLERIIGRKPYNHHPTHLYYFPPLILWRSCHLVISYCSSILSFPLFLAPFDSNPKYCLIQFDIIYWMSSHRRGSKNTLCLLSSTYVTYSILHIPQLGGDNPTPNILMILLFLNYTCWFLFYGC